MSVSKASVETLRNFWKAAPPINHVVLGSGFGEALQKPRDGFLQIGVLPFAQVPGLTPSTAPDHRGQFELWKNGSRSISFQCGRLHGYEGHSPLAAIAPVRIAHEAGAKRFFLTNAAGGLKREFETGSCMMIDDHINWTFQTPLRGPTPTSLISAKPLGARFPDMGEVYSLDLRNAWLSALKASGLVVHRGVYVGLLGPSFETASEIQMMSKWGCGAVGMSTVWEAIWLRFVGAPAVALSLISNPGTGLLPEYTHPLSPDDILQACRVSADRILDSILEVTK